MEGIDIGSDNDNESASSSDTPIALAGSEADGCPSKLIPSNQAKLAALTREIHSLQHTSFAPCFLFIICIIFCQCLSIIMFGYCSKYEHSLMPNVSRMKILYITNEKEKTRMHDPPKYIKKEFNGIHVSLFVPSTNTLYFHW